MKKTFKSCFSRQIEVFIQYRTSLGYKNIQGIKSYLKQLDRFLPEADIEMALSPSFFLDFKKNMTGTSRTVNKKLAAAKLFYDYLVRTEQADFNPLQDIPPGKDSVFIPFIFSRKETEALLCALQNQIRHHQSYFFLDMMLYTAIVLLARCGLRISEPCKLLLDHYRPYESTIYIKQTKFGKDRLISIPKSVANALNNYLEVRKGFCDVTNPFFFPGKSGKSIVPDQIYPAFNRAVTAIGLNQPALIAENITFGKPCPHSLRHSFAINTLKTIREKGKSPQQALPVLSVYMGHTSYKYTAVYLKLTDADHRRHLVDMTQVALGMI